MEIRYFETSGGYSPFAEWFAKLDSVTRARVTAAIARMEQGNLSQSKPVGHGVLEYKMDFGPGYRIYFGRDGEQLVILLTGGTKRRQQRDIDEAWGYWQDYKRANGQLDRGRPMARARSFRELVQHHVGSDPAFAEALLREGIQTMLAGDIETGKTILRDYIKATVGFEKLGKATGTQPKSLIRMFGPRGNPQARNLFSVISYLQKQAGLQLRVTCGS